MASDCPTPDHVSAIRRIYFETSGATIERDFARAIEILKAMGSDEERERAAVYMQGLSQMRTEWSARRGAGGGRKGKRR
jgi:hypothetical protein